MSETEKVGRVLHEATLLGVAVEPEALTASVYLNALALPGDADQGQVVLEMRLHGVTRVAASLRAGVWSDTTAPVERFESSELSTVVDSFGHLPVYGDDCIDSDNAWMKDWGDKLSLDWRLQDIAAAHSLDLFQERAHRHLDLRIWFNDLVMLDRQGVEQPIDALVEAADRWWAGMRSGDPRTSSSGIFPLKG